MFFSGIVSDTSILGSFAIHAGGLIDPFYVKGGQFPISSSTNRLGWPRVACSSGGNFLVVWIKFNKGNNQDVVGQLISRSGMFLGDEIPIAAAPDQAEGFPNLAYSPEMNRFLVAWRNIDTNGDMEIYGRLLSDDGTYVSDRFPISSARAKQPRCCGDRLVSDNGCRSTPLSTPTPEVGFFQTPVGIVAMYVKNPASCPTSVQTTNRYSQPWPTYPIMEQRPVGG